MLSVCYRRERLLPGYEWVEKAIKALYCELVLENGQLLSPFLFAMVKNRMGYFIFWTVFICVQIHRCEWHSQFIAFHCLTLLS